MALAHGAAPPFHCCRADEDEDGKARRRGAKPSGKAGGASGSGAGAAGAAKKQPKTWYQKAWRLLTGWMASVVRLNGKKLLPSNAVVVRMMAPLVLWVVGVIIVFGASYVQLQGLQAPLSSLNGEPPRRALRSQAAGARCCRSTAAHIYR